jgi:hypothetical protein
VEAEGSDLDFFPVLAGRDEVPARGHSTHLCDVCSTEATHGKFQFDLGLGGGPWDICLHCMKEWVARPSHLACVKGKTIKYGCRFTAGYLRQALASYVEFCYSNCSWAAPGAMDVG